jgi:anti-sigma factor RsiW
MNFRDAESLSAYLDGQLSPSEISRLERRLAVDAELRQVLADLRTARGLLRQTARRGAPRNFTLAPTNPRVRAPQPRAVPILRFAGVLASVLFVATMAVNSLAPLAARTLAAAPAPAFGVGGGSGGGAAEAEVPEESLALAEPESAQAAEPGPPSQEGLTPTEAPAEPFSKQPASDAETVRRVQAEAGPIVPPLWVPLLAVVGILLVGLSIYMDRASRRNFRSERLEK